MFSTTKFLKLNLKNNFKSIVKRTVMSATQSSIIEQNLEFPDKIKINYVQSGAGNKSLLLMPGALGCSWTDFTPQIEQLPKLLSNYTIIAWDPPGYGKSIPPKRNFSVDVFHNDANYAHQLMTALNRPKYSILGWSDGGITALIAAEKYQESIEKIIVWGVGAYINKDEIKIYEGIRDVKTWSARMREPMEKLYGSEGFAKLWSEWIDCMLNIYEKKSGDLCMKEVEKITASTFLIHGKKDPMIASEHIPWLRKTLKNHKYYEFPEGKHNIHLRYPSEFNKLVAEFLNE